MMARDNHLDKMELPVFPEELFYSNILQYLPWRDLLTCRLVCNSLKKFTDSYIRSSKRGVPDSVPIEINETTKRWCDIDTFLDLRFPASSFYLNNPSGFEFYEGENVDKFLNSYHDQVISLRVRVISTCPTGPERNFYDTLCNMTSLRIDGLGRNENKEESIWETIPNPFNGLRVIHPIIELPDSFGQLKTLGMNVGDNNKRKRPISERRMFTFNVASLYKCLQLEEISFVLASNTSLFTDFYLADLFHTIRRCVRMRAIKHPHQQNLKIVDFSACASLGKGIVRRTSGAFMEMCRQLASEGVQLKNVRADLFQAFHPLLHGHNIISSVVESMKGLHPAVLRVQLPNLQSLSIDTWTQTSLHYGDNIPYLVQWPALKKLRVWVQTKKLRGWTRKGEEAAATPVPALFDILFGRSRPSLKCLSFLFGSKMLDTWSKDNLPYPSISSIIASCPNITKLVVYNFPEIDNLTFSKLWSGLTLLEEVRIVKCKHLGDEGFIGEDERNPVFLKLKLLKKMWLLNLDKMPSITDKAFQLVFRHLKLEELGLASRKPLKSITSSGIDSLLTGDFSTSIQKFPFRHWSLENTKIEDWVALQNRFRFRNNFKE